MVAETIQLAKEVTLLDSEEKSIELLLKKYLESKMEECKKEIKDYEELYNMNFEEFKEKLAKQISLSYENEKAYFEWEGAITNLRYFTSKLWKLEEHEN